MKWTRSLGRAERDSAMNENEENLNFLADRIAMRLQGQSMLPAIAGQIQACSFSAPSKDRKSVV